MQVLLVSTYELGRQPFGLASPAAWLLQAGAQVHLRDLSRQTLDENIVAPADLIAVYLPMHTATRLAVPLLPKLRRMNPHAHLCCYGLYAALNEELLRGLGAQTILGGEFESALLSLAKNLQSTNTEGPLSAPHMPSIHLPKQRFLIPERRDLPGLSQYARLKTETGSSLVVGYTEATRGCLHLCRHCPIVPVYQGRLRVVQKEVVLEDIRQQVQAGAEHVTFGDPDFFNGVGHSLAIVQELHRRHPEITYDVTIKIEHLLKHQQHLPRLRDTGCLFVTSAVEAVDDRILALLDKGHTRLDFVSVAQLFADVGLVLNPTFVAFTPWTTLEGYRDLLRAMADLNLVESVAPIQLGMRLLITANSRLLELTDIRNWVGQFDRDSLAYPWRHHDPHMDELCDQVLRVVEQAGSQNADRVGTFFRIWDLAFTEDSGGAAGPVRQPLPARATVPYLNEPWYC